MNPRFDVGKAAEEPKPTPEEAPSAPEIPVPEQPVPQEEEERDETEVEATGPEMVIEEPPKAAISPQEPIQRPQTVEPARVFETDITGHDIDFGDAADLQQRISAANQP